MLCSFSTGFDVADLWMHVKETLDIFPRYLSIVLQITFIANKQDLSFRGARHFDLPVPVIDSIIEGLFVRNVKDDHQSMGSSVVWACDSTETLVACGIPDLQFDLISLKREGLKTEIDSNGC